MPSDFVDRPERAFPELVEYLEVAEGHLRTLRLLDGVEVGSSARGPGVGRSPFVRWSSAGLRAALALLWCDSAGVSASRNAFCAAPPKRPRQKRADNETRANEMRRIRGVEATGLRL